MLIFITFGSVLALFVVAWNNVSLGKKIKQLKQRAKQGDASALLELGDIANQKAHTNLAEQWYRKAAQYGSVNELYRSAKELEKQKLFENSVGRLKVAAEYNHAPAKLSLANYLMKIRTQRDNALTLLESAASDGHANSQYQLAHHLITLGDMNSHAGKIAHYLELASAQGHVLAQQRYKDMLLATAVNN